MHREQFLMNMYRTFLGFVRNRLLAAGIFFFFPRKLGKCQKYTFCIFKRQDICGEIMTLKTPKIPGTAVHILNYPQLLVNYSPVPPALNYKSKSQDIRDRVLLHVNH